MTLILSLETATDVCSVALSQDDHIIDSKAVTERNVHSALLATLIQQIMEKNDISFTELKAVAVSKGPGSFTGLRIGVSIAKGIAYGLDIPVIGINTLESIALGASLADTANNKLWCPVIDARNNEVYFAVYDNDLNVLKEADAGLINDHSFSDFESRGTICFAGPAVDSNTIKADQIPRSELLYNIKPDATYIARLAYRKYQASDFEDITFFEPFYLRDFKVRNLSTRINKVLNNGKNK